MTYLVTARPGQDVDEVCRHWLEVHVPNFQEQFVANGGRRYVVNLAERTAGEQLLGLAELSSREGTHAAR